MTSQNFALASPRSAPKTPTRWMGLPVMEERLSATVACASPTGTSVCSSGGLVRTLPAAHCQVFPHFHISTVFPILGPAGLWTSKCSAPAAPHPAVPHPEQGRSTFHTCCQQQSLSSIFSCLTHVEEAAKNFPCSNHSRKRTSEWLAWSGMKQPLESLPCRSTAST